MKTGTRIAASLAVAALSVSLTAPAAPAAESSGSRPGHSQPVDAKPAAASVKELKARLRKAVKAKKKAAAAVGAATTKVRAAKDAGTPAIFAFQSASVALEEARGKHATARAALDRAQHLIGNENAMWDELGARMSAAQAGYLPLRDAYNAAQARSTELSNVLQALRTQWSTATANQNDAAVYVGNLSMNDIPQAQNSYNAALAAEANAWDTKERLRVDFANRKAQWDDTRKRNGHWEGLRNGTWRLVPGLDDADAALEQAQQNYNQSKNMRLDVEGYLNDLNRRLADAQADIAHWASVAADLRNQMDAQQQQLNAQSAVVNAASDAMAAYFTKNIEPLYKESDKLRADLAAAKANLPALVAAEKPLADAVAQATAAVGAATPAQQAAQAAIDAANGTLATAKAALVKATSKVRKLKKQIRRLTGGR